MKFKDLQGDVVVMEAFVAGQATAGTADEWVVGRVPFRGKVTRVDFTPVDTITGAATNHFRADLRNRGAAAAGTTDIATLAFDTGVNATAFVPKVLPVSATDADSNVAEGDILTIEKVVVGTGLAMPEGLVTVHIKAR